MVFSETINLLVGRDGLNSELTLFVICTTQDRAARWVGFLDASTIGSAFAEVANDDWFGIPFWFGDFLGEITPLPKTDSWSGFHDLATSFHTSAIGRYFGAGCWALFGAGAIGFALPAKKIATITKAGAFVLVWKKLGAGCK